MVILRKLKKTLSSLAPALSRSQFHNLTARLHGLSTRKFVVFLGHADYLVSGGGTEKYQADDLIVLNANGYDVVQIYPLPYNNRHLYGVNWNDRSLAKGVTSGQIRDLVTFLRNLENFFSFNIHHLLGWEDQFLWWFVSEVKGAKLLLYLHDFYSLCPSKHLLHDDQKYCGYLESHDDGVVCRSCRYEHRLKDWRNMFSAIFDVAEHVICPSVILADAIGRTYAVDAQKLRICEHLRTVVTDRPVSKGKNKKLKVAYLGYRKNYKGWDVFRAIYKNPQLSRHYDFYHIGSNLNLRTIGLNRVSYSFHKNPLAAVDALLKHEIDLVLLLSLVPESYSFTLHESFAAGVPVIALEQSGNIAWKINKGEVYGRVFPDDDSLIAFLGDFHEVGRLLDKNPQMHTSILEHESAFMRLFVRGECSGDF